MTESPRWRRRKEARPGEIVAAAFRLFADQGYAATRIEAIAAEAGVSKGAVYRYFETKEALFRAVVTDAVRPNIDRVLALAQDWTGSFADLVRTLLPRIAAIATTTPIGAVIKVVVGESRAFPEVARVWHDEIVQPALGVATRLIAAAQARGEARPGDPRLHAFSLIGPMLLGVIWRETFAPIGGEPVDLHAIASQHAETLLAGLEARA